ncbi:unnamed protein product [Paramecium octaurelia]|uniref:Transmembrane protein n=1 Tax=Paramecium octaurelia TaxID=43137 RepID=A0A8S1WFE3_PAROT|nr:unnamed protein product [Paramecium octaurelia]
MWEFQCNCLFLALTNVLIINENMNNKTHEFEQIVPLFLNSKIIPLRSRYPIFRFHFNDVRKLETKSQALIYIISTLTRQQMALSHCIFTMRKCYLNFQDARDYFKNQRFQVSIQNLIRLCINHQNYFTLHMNLIIFKKLNPIFSDQNFASLLRIRPILNISELRLQYWSIKKQLQFQVLRYSIFLIQLLGVYQCIMKYQVFIKYLLSKYTLNNKVINQQTRTQNSASIGSFLNSQLLDEISYNHFKILYRQNQYSRKNIN